MKYIDIEDLDDENDNPEYVQGDLGIVDDEEQYLYDDPETVQGDILPDTLKSYQKVGKF